MSDECAWLKLLDKYKLWKLISDSGDATDGSSKAVNGSKMVKIARCRLQRRGDERGFELCG
jgi:hypothetical protein